MSEFQIKDLASASSEPEHRYHEWARKNLSEGSYPLRGKYRTPKAIRRGGRGSENSGTAKHKKGPVSVNRDVDVVAVMAPRADGSWSGKRRMVRS